MVGLGGDVVLAYDDSMKDCMTSDVSITACDGFPARV